MPVLLKELYDTMQKGDISVSKKKRTLTFHLFLPDTKHTLSFQFYQDLLNIQSEMAAPPTPTYTYNPGVSNPVPYSGRGRPPLNSMPVI